MTSLADHSTSARLAVKEPTLSASQRVSLAVGRYALAAATDDALRSPASLRLRMEALAQVAEARSSS